jgi:hypothetical protein
MKVLTELTEALLIIDSGAKICCDGQRIEPDMVLWCMDEERVS